jgi:predicted ATPase
MFLEAYTNYGINFIIETHSEYLVRKLQTMVARKQIDKNLISLTYVESDNTSNKKARRILIKDDGCLTEPFGEGFYDEADNLAMSLLMIKGGLA